MNQIEIVLTFFSEIQSVLEATERHDYMFGNNVIKNKRFNKSNKADTQTPVRHYLFSRLFSRVPGWRWPLNNHIFRMNAHMNAESVMLKAQNAISRRKMPVWNIKDLIFGWYWINPASIAIKGPNGWTTTWTYAPKTQTLKNVASQSNFICSYSGEH